MIKVQKGFTLVELLVVISVIGTLSTLILLSLNQTRAKARDIKRVADLIALRNVLELYYGEHGEYPKVFEPGGPYDHRMLCDHPTDYIPGVVPEYIDRLPSDPNLNCDDDSTHGFTYTSDGIDYKLITHSEGTYNKPELIDTFFDSGFDPCVLDNDDNVHIGVWSAGGRCWPYPFI